jgi:hypothetical protein
MKAWTAQPFERRTKKTAATGRNRRPKSIPHFDRMARSLRPAPTGVLAGSHPLRSCRFLTRGFCTSRGADCVLAGRSFWSFLSDGPKRAPPANPSIDGRKRFHTLSERLDPKAQPLNAQNTELVIGHTSSCEERQQTRASGQFHCLVRRDDIRGTLSRLRILA